MEAMSARVAIALPTFGGVNVGRVPGVKSVQHGTEYRDGIAFQQHEGLPCQSCRSIAGAYYQHDTVRTLSKHARMGQGNYRRRVDQYSVEIRPKVMREGFHLFGI